MRTPRERHIRKVGIATGRWSSEGEEERSRHSGFDPKYGTARERAAGELDVGGTREGVAHSESGEEWGEGACRGLAAGGLRSQAAMLDGSRTRGRVGGGTLDELMRRRMRVVRGLGPSRDRAAGVIFRGGGGCMGDTWPSTNPPSTHMELPKVLNDYDLKGLKNKIPINLSTVDSSRDPFPMPGGGIGRRCCGGCSVFGGGRGGGGTDPIRATETLLREEGGRG